MTESILNIALPLITIGFMLFGLAGLIIPVLPGLTIIWAAALLYWIIDGFALPSIVIFVILTIIMLVGNVIDNFFMGGSARKAGASWVSIAVAIIGGIIGTLVLPPLGGILFAIAGIFLVEYIRLRNLKQAWESTRSLAIGIGWAAIVRAGLGVVMITLWAIGAFLLA